jgi:hypothetical protein
MKNILIILPYGNLHEEEGRAHQLATIVAAFKKLCIGIPKNIKIFILISEQITPMKYFNRGQLLNIAVRYFRLNIGTPSCIIFHDIDIVPNAAMFSQYYTRDYKSFSLMPVGSAQMRAIYPFPLEEGSAVYLIDTALFTKINGFPNNFWSWGGEDNALHNRLQAVKAPKIVKNKIGEFISLDKQRTTHANKMAYLKKKNIRNMRVWELLDDDKKQWSKNGYNQLIHLNYTIESDEIECLSMMTLIHIKINLGVIGLENLVI